jgi:UDP-GlcNAc:undecaprenyl-phosphate GlcNAc-1-phosphate transferase
LRESELLKKFGLNSVWFQSIAALMLGLCLMAPQTKDFFAFFGLRWLHIFLFSFFLSICLTPFFRWAAFKLEILDRPSGRKLHQTPTPLLGGAAIFTAFLGAILLNGIFSSKLGAILAASTLLFLVGIADDIKEIPVLLKLGAQLICTAIVMFYGIVLNVVPQNLGFFSQISNVLLTIFWLVGITNAMNFFDGMDGMAAGLGVIISLFLGIVAFQTQQAFLGWVAVGMMGSCLGFLPYNLLKKGGATIFLGDAGSTVLGFVLASIAVYGDWAQNDPIVAIASPLLIFWVLIFDMIHITIDRILTGKVLSFKQWVEYVGRDHLHHRLALVLGGQKRSVFFIYLLSICLGTSAVVLRNARPIDAILLLIQASILVVLITILERRGRILSDNNI